MRPTVSSRRGGIAPRALVRVLLAWHALVALGVLAALILVLAASMGPGPGPARVGVIALLALTLVVNAVIIPLLHLRRVTGRVLSLAVNYLAAVGSVAVLLQQQGVFVGLDTLAGRFHLALPFLGVALLGWFVVGGEDASARRKRTGRAVIAVGLAAALVAVGLFPGLWTLLRRIADPAGLALLSFGLAAGALAWRSYASDVAREFDTTHAARNTIDGLLLVSPNLLGFIGFFAGPLLFSLFVSLHEWDAFGTTDFIGLGNYTSILALDLAWLGAGEAAGDALKEGYFELTRFGDLLVGARDPLFWRSIVNILKFSLLAIPLAVVPAVFLAVLLNSKVPGIRFFRSLYFVPSIAGVVAVALIWRQLFNATVGWVNYLIARGVEAWNALPLLPETTDPQIRWLSDADVALYSLVIVFAWQYIGFNTVLFFAGLQGIPGDLYEAAALDGASRWQRFRHITLPALSPTTFFVVASTGILALQLFGESVVLFPMTTPAGAGPGNSTLTPVVYLYEQGFRRFSQGYASAVAWVLFALIFAFTFLQFRRQREGVEG